MDAIQKSKETQAIELLRIGKSIKRVVEVTGLSFHWVKLKANQLKT